MAIVITEQPSGNVLNAYNNLVLEFYSNNAKTAISALVTIGTYTVPLTPHLGNFYCNLIQIVGVIMNQNAFKDTVELPTGSGYIYPDSTLYKEIDVSIEVKLNDNTSETTTLNLVFVKSVEQIIQEVVNKAVQEKIKLLLPYSSQVAYAAMFDSAPFEVCLYSNATRTITLRHKKTLATTTLNLTKGVNRIYLSNGVDTTGFQNLVPLGYGLNELEFIVDGGIYLTLILERFDLECGTYLKWFNQNGGWSYWKFGPVEEDIETVKSGVILQEDVQNVTSATSNYSVASKTIDLKRTLKSGMLNQNQAKLVNSIARSPKIYMFNNNPYESHVLSDFKEVRIDSSTLPKNKKQLSKEMKFDIIMPNQYLQNYAG